MANLTNIGQEKEELIFTASETILYDFVPESFRNTSMLSYLIYKYCKGEFKNESPILYERYFEKEKFLTLRPIKVAIREYSAHESSDSVQDDDPFGHQFSSDIILSRSEAQGFSSERNSLDRYLLDDQ